MYRNRSERERTAKSISIQRRIQSIYRNPILPKHMFVLFFYIAVSYTHLDVYKRQDGLFVSHTDEEGGSFCYPLGKGNKKKVLQYFMDDCKEKKIPFVLHGVTPVSYTHLFGGRDND